MRYLNCTTNGKEQFWVKQAIVDKAADELTNKRFAICLISMLTMFALPGGIAIAQTLQNNGHIDPNVFFLALPPLLNGGRVYLQDHITYDRIQLSKKTGKRLKDRDLVKRVAVKYANHTSPATPMY